MAKEKFQDLKFRPKSRDMIARINVILAEYGKQGFVLSLRQLYYQLVARGVIENSQKSYKATGDLVSNARLAGLVDWSAIEDRGRDYILPQHWNGPSEIIDAAARGYNIDKWTDQPYHVEIMVEKDALSGVLEPVARRFDVGITANKGYSSSSAMYYAGKRIARAIRAEKDVMVLYLGDHDPSGIDMTRDVRERLEQFARNMSRIEVVRLALNMDQVEEYDPPENPAKLTDSRAEGYIAEFGDSSWELDALEPTVLATLVEEQIAKVRDQALWDARVEEQEEERRTLTSISKNYDTVEEYLDGEGLIEAAKEEGDDEG